MEQSRPARPWDLFNQKIGRVTERTAENRLEICKACPFYVGLTHQCTKCGCIMNLKVKLPTASCPIGKWGEFSPINEASKPEKDTK